MINEETGILVAVRSDAALVEGMQKLLNRPELRSRMGKNARKYAEKSFAVETVVRKHLEIYSFGLAPK